MDMLNKFCKAKIDEIIETIIETQCNQNKANSNMAYMHYKFDNFISKINQVIQNSL